MTNGSTNTMEAAPAKETARETVAGYELIERIGTGGYGEVWKAAAPGGFLKAIKIVHGHAGEDRATRELRSLNRLCDISHPFLLSLERVDVVDERLVIVSELADSSLAERYQSCRRAGMPGIPREELLGYLREAAEALDFLYARLSLQHLDVKPDNILLVGQHAKVADFGLVKSVAERAESLVNGLTPRYSSPEVFEGRPTPFSDQYSLAIVYQELGAGQLPFDGATAAHLASQHLHSPPDLSSLEPCDRYVVGKALAKDPERRFPSCREFIDRLANPRAEKLIFSAQPKATVNSSPDRTADTDSPLLDHDGQTLVVAKPEVQRAAAPQVDEATAVHRPTIVIGLGGEGGAVVREIRRLYTDRFGDAALAPCFALLHIDTDVEAVNATLSLTAGGDSSGIETLAVPLQSSAALRKSSLSAATSLSRRWLYNIPRSLKTEGLRALGRVALLAHSEKILGRLRATLSQACESESLEASFALTGLKLNDYNPRVFLVGSAEGGTSSGMFIDLAYAVRQTLVELGLNDEDVHGFLTLDSRAGGAAGRLA